LLVTAAVRSASGAPMPIEAVILISGIVAFAIGVLVHRWWVLLLLGLVWWGSLPSHSRAPD
jgi:hypothetical protein